MSRGEGEALEIRLLGELELRRGGELLALPPSRKTRALLAYLIVTRREHRRAHLCDLFWDVTDDPKGALRWSLSKIRGIVDDAAAVRLVTDRERVAFVAGGAWVDLEVVRRVTARPLVEASTQDLEDAVALHRGELLEGLDLGDFDGYQAWCVAEREAARAARTKLLCELVARHAASPERAVEHARALVRIDPIDEQARARLIRLLGALGLRDEARQHYEAGKRLERELSRTSRGELDAALGSLAATAHAPPVPGGAEARAAATPARPAVEEPGGIHGAVGMFGRATELDALDALARSVERAGELRLLLVAGEPGVGKTRLLGEWAARESAAGRPVLRGACFETETGHPYAPWREALARSDALPGALRDERDGTGTQDAGARERMFERVSDALVALASRSPPVLLLLDDVQWLDEASIALLDHVARRCRAVPLALVLAIREGELPDKPSLARVLRGLRRDRALDELRLERLGVEDTAALVAATGSGADPGVVFAQTHGNPLFALELASAGPSDERVPSTLGGLIRDRLAQLPRDAQEVVRWAAVLGSEIDADKLEVLSSLPPDDVVAALEVLERRAVLTASRDGDAGLFSFAHDVVRRVVYEDLSEPRRRVMHRRVAQLLARRVDVGGAGIAHVAYHATRGHDAALAADACLAAARRSLRLFAPGDAFALARRGASHAEQLDEPDRTRRLLELAEVAFAARRPRDVDEATARVRTLAERALALGCTEHARLGFHVLAYLSWESGVWSDAKSHMLRAESVSRGASEPERIRGMAEAARCLVLLERDLGHAHALALEAAARGRAAGVEPPATYDALGMLELHQGRFGEAETALQHARSLAQAVQDHYDEFQALEHLTLVELESGRCDAALARAEELCVLGERFREGSEAPFARALAALARVELGDEGAEAELDRELDALAAVDAKHRLAYLLSRAARLDVDRGRTERAQRRATRALRFGQILGRATEVALAHLVLARCAAGRERDEHVAALGRVPLAEISEPVRRLIDAAALAPGGSP